MEEAYISYVIPGAVCTAVTRTDGAWAGLASWFITTFWLRCANNIANYFDLFPQYDHIIGIIYMPAFILIGTLLRAFISAFSEVFFSDSTDDTDDEDTNEDTDDSDDANEDTNVDASGNADEDSSSNEAVQDEPEQKTGYNLRQRREKVIIDDREDFE